MRRAPDTRALRCYRGLLWMYPAEFREEYGRELCLVFRDKCREQRSWAGLMILWLYAAWGVLTEAPREHIDVMMHDLKYAIRILRKEAAVTASAVAILGLGIGAATLVFSVANGLLLRPLPYREPDRLVAVMETRAHDLNFRGNVAFPNYHDIRTRTRVLEDVGVYTEGSDPLRGDGEAEQVACAWMSDGVFGILGIRPLLGRTFTRAEDAPNGPKVVLLSHDLWQRRYGGDPKILGKALSIGSASYEVIGVMPADFHFPEVAEVWRPLQMDPLKARRTGYFLEAVARLKPGATVGQASSELASMMAQINKEHPVTDGGLTARALPLRDSVAGQYRPAILVLLAAVALLLLIACANVSNLLLVKSLARRREMAVRTALGATRRRLLRQLVAESIVLGGAGGVVGTALAFAGIPALLGLIPAQLPRWMDFSADLRVLGFAFGLSLLTSLAFGAVPAFMVSGDLSRVLSEAGRSATTARRQQFLRNGLVIGEVALSLTLLIGAGLMVRSFLALRNQSFGYRPERVLTMLISAPGTQYPNGPKTHQLLRQLDSEIRSLAGVRSLAFGSGVPMLNMWGRNLTVEGYPLLALKDAPIVFHVVATPGYFGTLEIPLREGRDFTEADYDNPDVTVVGESLARKYWPGQSAIGKRVRYGPPENNEPWKTIVGVAADARNEGIRGQTRMNVYLPYHKGYTPTSLLVRTAGDPLQLAGSVKARIAGVDRNLVVSRILTLEQVLDRAAWQDRFFTVLIAVFAGVATLLAAAGLYAIVAYSVSLRTHEIGIRMALGASGAEVRRMVMRHGLTLAGSGLLLGVIAASALTQFLRAQLFRTSPTDIGTYAAVVGLMLAVALVAAFIPSRRATRVDPLVALRQD